MEVTRKEIMPCVWLTCVTTDKFKTARLSLSLLTQLGRRSAAKNALIPFVLRRGTTRHPDMDSLAAALDELYGARIEPSVRKKGEIQTIGFSSAFVDDRCLPEGEGVLAGVVGLMAELLLSPNTRGGLFLPEYADSERDKLLDAIRGRINDKYSYAPQRLIELMCPNEDYSVYRLGTEAEAEGVSYWKLTKRYRTLLSESPIEIFYCGSAPAERVEELFCDALRALPRGEPNLDVGTDIRMNAVEEKPRRFTEELNVTQGKLSVGFRLGPCMAEPDPAVIRTMNAVYGGCVTSKLFTNMRERLQLCYYASSTVDLHKGIMTVSSGVDFDKFDEALAEMTAQLEAVKNGDVTPEELSAAKKSLASDLRALEDLPAALDEFWLSRVVDGDEYTPAELASAVEAVTAKDVCDAAKGLECDAIFFLRGNGEGENDAPDEI